MNDPVFTQAAFWFFVQRPIVLYSVGVITVLVAIVGFLLIVKRWGDGY